MARVPPPTGPVGPAGREPSAGAGDNGLALAALVCGLLSVVLIFVPPVTFIGILLSLIAIGVGIGGLRQSGRLGGTGRGMAITGIVAGGISVAFIVFGAVLLAGSDEGQELLDELEREAQQEEQPDGG